MDLFYYEDDISIQKWMRMEIADVNSGGTSNGNKMAVCF